MIKFNFFRHFVCLLLLCCFSQNITAQRQISGKVTEALSQEPLIGVNVYFQENPGAGTTTDIDGRYTLEIEDDSNALIFSFIGYEEQIISIGTESVINVLMQEDAKQLEEVVVTALGIKRQKREVGYSTESFDGESLVLSNAPNFVNALSGKSAGVQVTSGNGVDGGSTRFVIRGNNNIKGENQPLIVVDGVPLENPPGNTSVKGGRDWGSAINNINPNDIESLDILKGPTASALYGSRGANGVVLITTKRGGKQKGLGVNYSVVHKIIQPAHYRDVQNTFGAGGPVNLLEPSLPTNIQGELIYPSEGSDIHSINGPLGKSTTELFGFYSTGMSWGPRMEGQMVRWWDGELRPFSPQPDNLKQYFSNGKTTTHNVSFSGGGDMGSIRVSLTRSDHTAIVPNSGYDQSTVNIGSRLNISSKIKADLSLSYINYNRKNSPSLGDDNNSSFGKGILYSWPRSYKGLEKDINILADGSQNQYDYDVAGGYPFTFAPRDLWWNTYHQNTELSRNKLVGALSISYTITPWLMATGRMGTDFNLDQFEERHKPINSLGIDEGYYANELKKDISLNKDFLIAAHKDKIFNSPLDVRLSVGGNQWYRNEYLIGGRSGGNDNPWVNSLLYSFNNFGTINNTNQITREDRLEKKINSLYSFLNLDYKDFIFLELTGRNDWSSTLPSDVNSYFYPSSTISFIATEAFDLDNIGWLSFLKLRAGYAETATDADPYQLDFVYETGTLGGQQTAALPTVIPPLKLRPQLANSYEFGLSFGFFEDKINMDFAYYKIRSFEQILDAPIPSSSGASTVVINTGELENKGLEAILDITLFQNRKFFWQTGLNFSNNINRLVSLGDSGAKLLEIGNIWGSNGPSIAVREGDEFGTITGFDYVYHEESGQPILNEEGTHYKITDSKVPIGNAAPDFIGGWTMRLGYKGLTLSTLVDTKWGGDIYAGSYVIGLQTGQSPLTLPERMGQGLAYTDPNGNTRNVGVILPGVYEDGTANDKVVHYYFKYIGNTGGWGRYNSKPGIQKNSWIKLREIALNYKLPQSIAQKTKVFQDLTISLTGRDLFYLYTSLPDGINPEGNNGSGNAQGLEWAAFPGSRSFSLGVNASF